jgi:hypothetical protein
MKRRGNPRRDAIEYGILLTVATSLSVGFGLLVYMKYNEDGENGPPRQRLDMNAPLDLQQAWRELQNYGRNGGGGGGGNAGNNPSSSAADISGGNQKPK